MTNTNYLLNSHSLVNPRPFESFDSFIDYLSIARGLSRQEVKSAFKRLKRLGLIRYSTKSKNRFTIKFNDDELIKIWPEAVVQNRSFGLIQ